MIYGDELIDQMIENENLIEILFPYGGDYHDFSWEGFVFYVVNKRKSVAKEILSEVITELDTILVTCSHHGVQRLRRELQEYLNAVENEK